MKDRIRQLRRSLDLTQQDFADRISVKRNTVATYEMGRNVPTDAVIDLICREYKVNKEWLKTGNGSMFVERTRDEDIADFIGKIQLGEDDSFKKRFIAMLSALDESDWEVLEKIAVMLQKKGTD